MKLWDILLLIIVPVMGTLVAYIRSPRYKAFVLCFPIPFTLAVLALGENVNATHALGLLVMMGFWFLVYYLRHNIKMPILAAIVLSTITYCVASIFLAKILPRTETSFWVSEILVVVIAALLWRFIPHREEKAYGSNLPVWIKFPIMFAVIWGLIAMKSLLSGFMTVFPMVGVLTAYETRYSLWTSCRQIPVVLLSLAAMMAIIRLAFPLFCLGAGLAAGWVVMGLVLAGLTSHHWRKEGENRIKVEG